MSYKIVFDRPAEKQFLRLPADIRQGFARRLSDLTENPRPPDGRKLEGAKNCYRLRQGDYRLVYTILEDRVVVLVLRVGHRGDVYRGIPDIARALRKWKRAKASE